VGSTYQGTEDLRTIATPAVATPTQGARSVISESVGRPPYPIRAALGVLRSKTTVDIAFLALLLAIAAGRWATVADSPLPSGTDEANWLAFGHALTGEQIRSNAVIYPPVVPLLMLGFTSVWGPFMGAKILAVAASLIPAAGAYVLLRASNLGLAAAVLAGFLAAASSTGEAMAWGGYPQLIALGLLGPFLLALDRYLRLHRVYLALAAATLLLATLATNELVGGIALVASVAIIAMHLVIWPPGWIVARRLSLGIALVFLVSTPLIPLYMNLGTAVAGNFLAAGPSPNVTLTARFSEVEYLYRDFPIFWRLALALALVAPLALFAQRRTTLWLVTTALLIPTVVIFALTHELRFVYFLPLIAILALGCYLESVRRLPIWRQGGNVAVYLVLLVALTGQGILGLGYYAQQARFYTFLSPGLVAGIDWLRKETPPSTLVAVSSTRQDLAFGWWVEGLGRRRTLTGSAVVYLTTADERKRARESAQIFDRHISIDVALERARTLHVDYMFIVKDWPGYVDWSRASTPVPLRAIVIDNESLLLLRTR
jgi:hypothetical protein